MQLSRYNTHTSSNCIFGGYCWEQRTHWRVTPFCASAIFGSIVRTLMDEERLLTMLYRVASSPPGQNCCGGWLVDRLGMACVLGSLPIWVFCLTDEIRHLTDNRSSSFQPDQWPLSSSCSNGAGVYVCTQASEGLVGSTDRDDSYEDVGGHKPAQRLATGKQRSNAGSALGFGFTQKQV